MRAPQGSPVVKGMGREAVVAPGGIVTTLFIAQRGDNGESKAAPVSSEPVP